MDGETLVKPLSDLMLPCLPRELALFLDFDGTLADIVENPEDVFLAAETLAAISTMHQQTSGAIAIVTGRSIEQIDTLLEPLTLPVAGVHGMARRTFDGSLHEAAHDAALLAEVQARLTSLHLTLPGTLIELKPGSVAFHYRRRPDLQAHIAERVHDRLGDLEGLDLLHGKMVVEAKAGHAHKGSAIRAFMLEPPFAGRTPVFAGDDVTDEFGFHAIAAIGGVSIKIGPGDTAAEFRAADPEEFRQWLFALADSAQDLAEF